LKALIEPFAILIQRSSDMNEKQVAKNRRTVESWYDALARGDSARMLGLQWEDVIYNIHGTTPVSGRFQGNDTLVREIFPRVFGRLQMDTFKFCTKCKIMCADDQRVVAFMQADGHALNGVRYNQTYCHVFGFRDGKIGEFWEFFDSVLAESAINDNNLMKPTQPPEEPFKF
jgi:ketosteroid isomerase-like protein